MCVCVCVCVAFSFHAVNAVGYLPFKLLFVQGCSVSVTQATLINRESDRYIHQCCAVVTSI